MCVVQGGQQFDDEALAMKDACRPCVEIEEMLSVQQVCASGVGGVEGKRVFVCVCLFVCVCSSPCPCPRVYGACVRCTCAVEARA